jgi:putative ABC transport system ATP-binding protein
MITLKSIQFQYPKSDFKLHIKDLKFEKGSRIAIIGPSGFGKTTTLNLLAGILLPDEGSVNIKDVAINELSDSQRRNFRIQHIGFVFQDFRLIPYLNILDNILLPYRINGVMKIKNDTIQNAKDVAEEMGIFDKLKKYPSKLSHGERQRVAICRALLNRPPIILADEPTGNLDPENKRKIMDILFNYVEKYNTTLITVTHDHEMLKGFEQTINFADFQEN